MNHELKLWAACMMCAIVALGIVAWDVGRAKSRPAVGACPCGESCGCCKVKPCCGENAK